MSKPSNLVINNIFIEYNFNDKHGNIVYLKQHVTFIHDLIRMYNNMSGIICHKNLYSDK